jgi:hypothetical protein
MNKLKQYGKIIVLDTLAGLCFIGVILFGWLPGPGGLPLLLAGLALLAVNHDWAERWLETAKHKGKSFKAILFPDKAWIRNTYDIASVLVFGGAVYLFLTTNNRFVASGCIAAACFSFFIFLVNRERLNKLSTIVQKKKA